MCRGHLIDVLHPAGNARLLCPHLFNYRTHAGTEYGVSCSLKRGQRATSRLCRDAWYRSWTAGSWSWCGSGPCCIDSGSPLLYEALRWGGVAYLLWLAWDGWRDATEIPPAGLDGNGVETKVFTRGLVTNLLNPKAAVFYVAVLPTFVDALQPVLGQAVTLSVVYVLVATAVHTTIVSLAGIARPFLDDPDRSRIVRRGLSVALGAIAVWFAFSTAR